MFGKNRAWNQTSKWYFYSWNTSIEIWYTYCIFPISKGWKSERFSRWMRDVGTLWGWWPFKTQIFLEVSAGSMDKAKDRTFCFFLHPTNPTGFWKLYGLETIRRAAWHLRSFPIREDSFLFSPFGWEMPRFWGALVDVGWFQTPVELLVFQGPKLRDKKWDKVCHVLNRGAPSNDQ